MKLGAIYSKEKTTFTLFSPVADSVFVIFYDKENENLNYENYGLWFYDTDGSESYRNAVFPEGTELEVDDGDLILTPSGSVKNQNYDSFYDMYRYRSQ